MGAAPLSYLTSHGAKADATLPLTTGLAVISVAVILIVTALLLAGVIRRRAPQTAVQIDDRDASAWLYIGVGASTFFLVVALVWTVRVLGAINAPAAAPAFTIEVTGQQWWWKAHYLDADPSREIVTANELHIPVGKPVRIQLVGADVIHSFWVPALGGKTDAIPGQLNNTWIEADHAGRFRGQCTEYCGEQHAHMGFDVVAESDADFEQWRSRQREPAAPAVDATKTGETAFVFRCGACHTVRGTEAGGTAGPDLTHLMSRASIAADSLPNDAGSLAAWLANPQAIKPGNHMPMLQLSGAELGAIDAYLVTLK
jgi:cytochrome c oxidase subunit 2